MHELATIHEPGGGEEVERDGVGGQGRGSLGDMLGGDRQGWAGHLRLAALIERLGLASERVDQFDGVDLEASTPSTVLVYWASDAVEFHELGGEREIGEEGDSTSYQCDAEAQGVAGRESPLAWRIDSHRYPSRRQGRTGGGYHVRAGFRHGEVRPVRRRGRWR